MTGREPKLNPSLLAIREAARTVVEVRATLKLIPKSLADAIGHMAAILDRDVGRPSKVSEERKQRILEMHELGESISEIARQLQMPRTTVDRTLKAIPRQGQSGKDTGK